MKKYRSIKSYIGMLNEFYDPEDNVNIKNSLEEFVGKDKFVIYDVVEEGDFEDNIIKVRDKYYWMVERYEGLKFVEINDFEEIKDFVK